MNDRFEDVCYECTGLGDDYSIDENGELVCNCDDCPFGFHADGEPKEETDNTESRSEEMKK